MLAKAAASIPGPGFAGMARSYEGRARRTACMARSQRLGRASSAQREHGLLQRPAGECGQSSAMIASISTCAPLGNALMPIAARAG